MFGIILIRYTMTMNQRQFSSAMMPYMIWSSIICNGCSQNNTGHRTGLMVWPIIVGWMNALDLESLALILELIEMNQRMKSLIGLFLRYRSQSWPVSDRVRALAMIIAFLSSFVNHWCSLLCMMG